MGFLILLLTTFIWGTAFLAQKLGANHLGPFAVTVLRNILGGAFLLVLVLIRRMRGTRVQRSAFGISSSILAGVACGVPLFAAMLSQQIGIEYTMPGISAFLTTNYVLFVPLIVAAVSRQLPSRRISLCVLLALVGTYFICVNGGTMAGIGKGEWWTILCAFLFAVQMMVVASFAARSDLLIMSATQLLTCAVLGAPFLLLPSEMSRLHEIGGSVLPLIYLGVFSSGIAYTLQNFGQAKTPPSVAAVVLSLESVFGALSGWLVLGDRLSPLQLAGCALVFVAAVSAQLPSRRNSD